MATAALYFLIVMVAEPLRTFAATTAGTWVSFTQTTTLSLTCSGTATVPPAVAGVTASTGNTIMTTCTPIANSSLGYTLNWIISSSTGTLTPLCTPASRTVSGCYGTGHLMNTNVTSGKPDLIERMWTRVPVANLFKIPYQLNATTNPTASGARWAARLSSTSTTTGGGDITWGSDGATETYVPVATGSTVNIAKRQSDTASTGDVEVIRWKVIIPSGVFIPTGTYKAYVQFTVTDNS